MRTITRLQKLFTAALALVPVAACASGVDRSQLHDDVCNGTGKYDPLAGVTPGQPVDYIELRGSAEDVISKTGTPCATATERMKCNATLSSTKSAVGWNAGRGQIPGQHHLVFTRGDTVGTVTSFDDLRTFLAPVDDVHDAAMLVAEQPGDLTVQCGASTGGPVPGGFEVIANSGNTCGGDISENRVFVSVPGVVAVRESSVIQRGDSNCSIGRRPEGLERSRGRTENEVGAFFATVSHLEAASVFAFERLGRELETHGAPLELVRACERSRREEVRHAQVTAEISRAYDAEPDAPRVGELPVRTLFEVALENAVEGCVRETFGALVAMHQHRHATDPRVVKAMRTIAREETGHAALSWDIAEWIEPQLTGRQRATLSEARAVAVQELRCALATEVAPELVTLAGMPAPSDAVKMFDAIAPCLWA